MKRNIKRFTVKLTSALFLAAAIMSVGTTLAKADEIDTQPTECVETEAELEYLKSIGVDFAQGYYLGKPQ